MQETSKSRQSDAPGSTLRRFPGFFTLSLGITLVGIGMSITRPYLSLFYTDSVHMSPLELGLFTFINGLGGIVASTWLGRRSDTKTPKKDVLLVSTVSSGIGYLSFLWLHSYWLLLVASTILMGLGASAYPQLFAYSRETAQKAYKGDATTAISTLRSFFSLAWVIGPLCGTWLLSLYQFKGLFFSTAVLFAVVFVLVLLRLERRPAPVQAAGRGAVGASNVSQLLPTLKRTEVWMASVSTVAVNAATSMNMMYMPLFLTHTLHGPTRMVGWVVSLSAGLEIPIMIGLGSIAERVGKRILLLLGSVFGTLYYFGVAFSHAPWEMLVLQLLCAVFVSIAVSIGMSYFQDFMPDAPGSATTLFSNAGGLGSMAGSLLGGVVAQAFGFRSVFWLCTFLGAISFIFLLRRRSQSMPNAHTVLPIDTRP